MGLHTPRKRLTLVTALLVLMTLIFTLLLITRTLSEPGVARGPVLASLFKHNLAFLESVPIMPLGDSITAGVGSANSSGYRAVLWDDYQAAGYRVNFVGSAHSGPQDFPQQNEGHPGWRIDQLSSHIADWLSTAQPRIILLHIGTNDILQHDDLPLAPVRLTDLLERITQQLPTALIIVAQITPLGNPLLNSEIVAYNRTIPIIVRHLQQQGKHISYVDMYDAVPVKDLRDGIHPDDAGYALMATVWYKATVGAL